MKSVFRVFADRRVSEKSRNFCYAEVFYFYEKFPLREYAELLGAFQFVVLEDRDALLLRHTYHAVYITDNINNKIFIGKLFLFIAIYFLSYLSVRLSFVV